MRILIAVILMVVGCGGGTDQEDLLEGDWAIEWPQQQCATVANFDGARYGLGFICVLTNGAFGMELEKGTYSTSGSTLTTVADQATCANVVKVGTATYTATKTTLTVSGPGGALVFTRNNSTAGGGGGVTFGCFNGDTFTPSPLAPI